MKKILYLIFIMPLFAMGQSTDSLDIRVGGTGTRIARPGEGEQTTIRMKDSLTEIEIRVGSTKVQPIVKDSSEKRYSSKYFSELSTGLSLAGSINTESVDPIINMNSTDHYSVTYTHFKPAVYAGISLKKSSLRLVPNFYLDLGMSYRFMALNSEAVYESYTYTIVLDSANPITLGKVDSHDSTDILVKKAVHQFNFPVMLRYDLSELISVSAGMVFDISFEKTRVDGKGTDLNGELYKDMNLREQDYPRFQLRPQFIIRIGSIAFNISKDLVASSFGYGLSERKTTRFTHIGVSYSLF